MCYVFTVNQVYIVFKKRLSKKCNLRQPELVLGSHND